MSELTINRCKICSLLALHFNKLDLCNFCRSILIFHNIYQLNNQNPKLKILQSTAPFNSTAPFDNRIMASTHLLPKQGYAIIFYYPNPISTCNPFKNPYLRAIHSKNPLLTSSPRWSFPGPPVTQHCPTSHTLMWQPHISWVIVPWASSDNHCPISPTL